MALRMIFPVIAAALVLGACDDKPTAPEMNPGSDAAMRSISTNAPFGPLVLPATGALADGGAFAVSWRFRESRSMRPRANSSSPVFFRGRRPRQMESPGR